VGGRQALSSFIKLGRCVNNPASWSRV
jgi:hypothetical protein